MEHLDEIRVISKDLGLVKIMEICGGHTNVIMKYGIRDVLPGNIRLISGPGCPVCVTSEHDIDCMIELAKHVPVATYGDMMRVPGSTLSLEDARSIGTVIEVYSATEVLKLAGKYPDIVFFGVGFETTAPMTAFLLENGVSVYSVHKMIPPAMKMLTDVDAFINPGHVSTIIGTDAYREIIRPQAIAGFTPERVLRAIRILLGLIRDRKNIVVNAYPEAVTHSGNVTARKLMDKHFKIVDCDWRGLGTIPKSGLGIRNPGQDAKIKYRALLKNLPTPRISRCRCGDVLRGRITPSECPLFGECSPENPLGACMVSIEGSCSIYYQYK